MLLDPLEEKLDLPPVVIDFATITGLIVSVFVKNINFHLLSLSQYIILLIFFGYFSFVSWPAIWLTVSDSIPDSG